MGSGGDAYTGPGLGGSGKAKAAVRRTPDTQDPLKQGLACCPFLSSLQAKDGSHIMKQLNKIQKNIS